MITTKKLTFFSVMLLIILSYFIFSQTHLREPLWYLLIYLLVCSFSNLVTCYYMDKLSNLISEELTYANKLKEATQWNISKIKEFIESYKIIGDMLNRDLSYINAFTILHIVNIKNLIKEIKDYKTSRSHIGKVVESENFKENEINRYA